MSSRQVQRESEIENLLISLMETNLETRKCAAKRLFELSNENRSVDFFVGFGSEYSDYVKMIQRKE